MKTTEFRFEFDWNSFPLSPIDNIPALVQVMAWRRTDAKPLPEPMLAQFTDAYMQHQGGDELTLCILCAIQSQNWVNVMSGTW